MCALLHDDQLNGLFWRFPLNSFGLLQKKKKVGNWDIESFLLHMLQVNKRNLSLYFVANRPFSIKTAVLANVER